MTHISTLCWFYDGIKKEEYKKKKIGNFQNEESGGITLVEYGYQSDLTLQKNGRDFKLIFH